WEIETQIVFFFRHLDSDGLSFLAGELAAAEQTSVSAFEGFEGEDGSLFDDDSLADVEPRQFLGDSIPEIDIRLLLGTELWAKVKPGAWHERLEPRRGLD